MYQSPSKLVCEIRESGFAFYSSMPHYTFYCIMSLTTSHTACILTWPEDWLSASEVNHTIVTTTLLFHSQDWLSASVVNHTIVTTTLLFHSQHWLSASVVNHTIVTTTLLTIPQPRLVVGFCGQPYYCNHNPTIPQPRLVVGFFGQPHYCNHNPTYYSTARFQLTSSHTHSAKLLLAGQYLANLHRWASSN